MMGCTLVAIFNLYILETVGSLLHQERHLQENKSVCLNDLNMQSTPSSKTIDITPPFPSSPLSEPRRLYFSAAELSSSISSENTSLLHPSSSNSQCHYIPSSSEDGSTDSTRPLRAQIPALLQHSRCASTVRPFLTSPLRNVLTDQSMIARRGIQNPLK